MDHEVSLVDEIISNKIYLIRSKKVMLDSDLGVLYQVETKRINEQVKRNISRFPDDFMFQLTEFEWQNLKSQFATSSLPDGKAGWGGRRKLPLVFTEHGVLMLSSVLNSERAISINIQIIKVFNKIREMLLTHKDLLLKMKELESKVANQDKSIKQVFNYLNSFIQDKKKSKRSIGFKQEGRDNK